MRGLFDHGDFGLLSRGLVGHVGLDKLSRLFILRFRKLVNNRLLVRGVAGLPFFGFGDFRAFGFFFSDFSLGLFLSLFFFRYFFFRLCDGFCDSFFNGNSVFFRFLNNLFDSLFGFICAFVVGGGRVGKNGASVANLVGGSAALGQLDQIVRVLLYSQRFGGFRRKKNGNAFRRVKGADDQNVNALAVGGVGDSD